MNIAVLMGGPSNEHDISLLTGQNVVQQLDAGKYRVLPVIIEPKGPNPLWIMDEYLTDAQSWQAGPWLKNQSNANKISAMDAGKELHHRQVDKVFLAMHGKFGEDGTIQHFLDTIGLPYTGSKGGASALAMHKAASKALCQSKDLAMALDLQITQKEWHLADEIKRKIWVDQAKALGNKIVIKAMDSGSSLDMQILDIDGDQKSLDSIYHTLENIVENSDVIIEEYIQGKEVTCGVLEIRKNGCSEPIPLAVTEIIPKVNGFFSYQAKYNAQLCQEITPAPLLPVWTERIQQQAVRCHLALGCGGYSRSDFILTEERLVYLETNTLPGMTDTSLLPQGAASIGITFPKLLDHILENAVSR